VALNEATADCDPCRLVRVVAKRVRQDRGQYYLVKRYRHYRNCYLIPRAF